MRKELENVEVISLRDLESDLNGIIKKFLEEVKKAKKEERTYIRIVDGRVPWWLKEEVGKAWSIIFKNKSYKLKIDKKINNSYEVISLEILYKRIKDYVNKFLDQVLKRNEIILTHLNEIPYWLKPEIVNGLNLKILLNKLKVAVIKNAEEGKIRIINLGKKEEKEKSEGRR